MALATRELELVIIARDSASSTLARVGGAVTLLGGAMTALGAKGVNELRQMTLEAFEFRQEMALALTQVELAAQELPEGIGRFLPEALDEMQRRSQVSLEDLREMARRVAGDIPVPFEDMGEAMFDIFSSVTLDSLRQAEDGLELFSRAAVAGQADVRDVGRAAIATVNAFQDLDFTAEDLQRVLDVQFEAVRKGIITYDEFATSIGRAIPAFANAGQDIELLSGSMAFLTRNGLSAQMAATSAARAVELLFSPKALKGMQSLGIELTDAEGNMRGMDLILRDLLPHFQDMDDVQRRLKFQEIFGTGRIQARRFFDLFFQNSGEFFFLADQMQESGGEMQDAYDLMFNQPQSQMELLQNRFKLLREEIGNFFGPTLSLLVDLGNDFLLMWQGLNDETKTAILTFSGVFLALFTLAGAFITAVGAGILFIGLMSAFTGVGAVAIIGMLGLIAAAVLGLAGAITFVILNWEEFDEDAQKILAELRRGWEAFMDFWDSNVGPVLSAFWDNTLKPAIRNFVTWLANTAVPKLVDGFEDLLESLEGLEIDAEGFDFSGIRSVFEGFQIEGVAFFEWWGNLWSNKIWPLVTTIFEDLRPVFREKMAFLKEIWPEVVETVKVAVEAISLAIEGVVDAISWIWRNFGDEIIAVWLFTWRGVEKVIRGALRIIKGVFNIIAALFTQDWKRLWEGVKQIFSGIWEGIIGILQVSLLGRFVKGFRALGRIIWNWARRLGTRVIGGITRGLTGLWRTIWNILQRNVIGPITSFLGFVWRKARSIGGSIVRGILNGLGGLWWSLYNSLKRSIIKAIDWVKRFFSSPLDLAFAVEVGKPIMEGIMMGISGEVPHLQRTLRDALRPLTSVRPGDMGGGGGGIQIGPIHTGASPQETAAEILWQMRMR